MSSTGEMSMVSVRVLFFAMLREYANTRFLDLQMPVGSSTEDLKLEIKQTFSEIGAVLDTAVVAVNHEFADQHHILNDGDEVAFFPPVSGGETKKKTILNITADEIDLNEVLNMITTPETGAACFFSGMVRGVTKVGDIHETEYLEYEAYLPMAESKIKQVADEIRERWPQIEGIAISQRIGRLYPGTPTVMIACTAAHRDTGVFEAARYGIDRLKEIVPVWKKEVGPMGQTWVEGNYFPKTGE